MKLDVAAATKTVTGYFATRVDAEEAIDSLQKAGFTQSQLSLAVRQECITGESCDSSATEEAQQKTKSVWNKVDFFAAEISNTHVYKRDGTHAESSSAVVEQPMHGGYGSGCNDSRESISKQNSRGDHSRDCSHPFQPGRIECAGDGIKDPTCRRSERHSEASPRRYR